MNDILTFNEWLEYGDDYIDEWKTFGAKDKPGTKRKARSDKGNPRGPRVQLNRFDAAIQSKKKKDNRDRLTKKHAEYWQRKKGRSENQNQMPESYYYEEDDYEEDDDYEDEDYYDDE